MGTLDSKGLMERRENQKVLLCTSHVKYVDSIALCTDDDTESSNISRDYVISNACQ